MREIKFRYIFNREGKILISIFTLEEFELSKFRFPSKSVLLGRSQFTALKDRNGKEVYEGDICKGYFETQHGKLKMTGKVFYDWNSFRLEVIKGDKRKGMVNYFDFREDLSIEEPFFNFEVVGNIYVNNLLEVKG